MENVTENMQRIYNFVIKFHEANRRKFHPNILRVYAIYVTSLSVIILLKSK